MVTKVLLVDDEKEILTEVAENLTLLGYECITGASGEEGLNLLRKHLDISIVLTDLDMPGKTGSAMIRTALSEFSDTRDVEFIVMTGHGAACDVLCALKLGVMDFLVKPLDSKKLQSAIRNAEQSVLEKRERRFWKEGLEANAKYKTLEIQRLYGSLQTAYSEVLDCLAVAAEYKDPETGNHIRRIGAYAAIFANELGWSSDRQEMIRAAAPLHDVGKIGIPESILLKPDKLTSSEIAIMKRHPEIGHRILAQSDHPIMTMAANIALGHHERWNGGGYPHGIVGPEIAIEARITTIADVYDALRSDRPYKFGFDQETTLAVMLEGDGRTDPNHFDPTLLEILNEKSDVFAETFEQLSDRGIERFADQR